MTNVERVRDCLEYIYIPSEISREITFNFILVRVAEEGVQLVCPLEMLSQCIWLVWIELVLKKKEALIAIPLFDICLLFSPNT